MPRKSLHVVPNGGNGWNVKQQGKVVAHTDTKKQALVEGTAHAKKQGAELVIHKADGTIQNSNSFGNDPNPPKDTK